MDNEFVDEIVQRAGGWDIGKRHTTTKKLHDSVLQYFPPIWLRDIAKGEDQIVSTIFGTDVAQTTPEMIYNGGDTSGTDEFRRLTKLDAPFFFAQRFVLIQPTNEVTGMPGFTLACCSQGRRANLRVLQTTHKEWWIGVQAIKILSVKNRQEELAAQERIQSFLMLLKMAA